MPAIQFHKPQKMSVHDQFGEKTEIIGSEKRREWQWGLPADLMGLKLPLCVHHCGNAVWSKGVRITRKNSFIFGLELVVSGDLEFQQDHKSYLVGPGQIYILHQGKNHSYATGPGGQVHKRFFCIAGQGQMLRTMLSELGLLDVDVVRLRDVYGFVRLFKAAARAFETRPPGFLTRLSELAYAVLLFLGNEMTGPRYPFPVQAALDHMHQHLNRQLSLLELAATANLSVPHFCRVFRDSTGTAPMVFLRKLRIRYAGQTLTGTTARINEVAERLGFEDTAYFSRVFAKETGLSPREFRRKMFKEHLSMK